MEYFVQEDFLKVKKQRKLTLIAYFVVLGVYLLFSAGMIYWMCIQPYQHPTINIVKLVHYSGTAIMVIFTVIFLGIKFKRVNKYYRMAFNLMNAKTEVSTGNFVDYDEQVQVKDGVECKALIFIEWNKYKNDFFERKVLVFYDREFPKIPENSNVRYVTQGNVLVSYELL